MTRCRQRRRRRLEPSKKRPEETRAREREIKWHRKWIANNLLEPWAALLGLRLTLLWDAVGVIGSARQLQKLSSRQVEQCIYPEPINNTYTPHRTATSAKRQPCTQTHTKSYIYSHVYICAYSINICYI